jgi:hypothetical protein
MFYWAYTYSVAVGVPVLLPRKEKARNEVAVPLLLTSPLGGYELSSRNMGLSPGVCVWARWNLLDNSCQRIICIKGC